MFSIPRTRAFTATLLFLPTERRPDGNWTWVMSARCGRYLNQGTKTAYGSNQRWLSFGYNGWEISILSGWYKRKHKALLGRSRIHRRSAGGCLEWKIATDAMLLWSLHNTENNGTPFIVKGYRVRSMPFGPRNIGILKCANRQGMVRRDVMSEWNSSIFV